MRRITRREKIALKLLHGLVHVANLVFCERSLDRDIPVDIKVVPLGRRERGKRSLEIGRPFCHGSLRDSKLLIRHDGIVVHVRNALASPWTCPIVPLDQTFKPGMASLIACSTVGFTPAITPKANAVVTMLMRSIMCPGSCFL